jgi:hypothetical protein
MLKSLLIKEETALLQECLTLEDDVAKIMRHELEDAIITWGDCSLEEVSKECRWHQLDDKAEPYRAYTIIGRWLEHVSLHVSVAWERAELHADSSLQLDCPGLAQLLPVPDELSDDCFVFFFFKTKMRHTSSLLLAYMLVISGGSFKNNVVSDSLFWPVLSMRGGAGSVAGMRTPSPESSPRALRSRRGAVRDATPSTPRTPRTTRTPRTPKVDSRAPPAPRTPNVEISHSERDPGAQGTAEAEKSRHADDAVGNVWAEFDETFEADIRQVRRIVNCMPNILETYFFVKFFQEYAVAYDECQTEKDFLDQQVRFAAQHNHYV